MPAEIEAPLVPRSLEAVQLPTVMIRDILLKTMFRGTLSLVSDLARALCLPIAVTQELVDLCRAQRLIEAMGLQTAGESRGEMPYQLTEAGKARALDALAQSEYYGALPVPMEAYAAQVRRQSIRGNRVTRAALSRAMGDMIVPDALLDRLGPAVGAGRSILMYGPPGNGKSTIAQAIRRALGDEIYVPRAVAHNGQVIAVFDPTVHSPVEALEESPGALRQSVRFDARYVLCRRPAVTTGGELSLDMLDLVHNSAARTYQASLQMKATGGIFIVDDLGRQAEPPQALINRWIVPLEENKDILTLQSGEKIEVPFDTLVIFSTNFHPNALFDQAALRRIFFKIRIGGPSQQDLLKIFTLAGKRAGMTLDEPSLLHLLRCKYPAIGNAYANYQPIFLVDQIKAICDFEGLPYRMTPDLVDRAWANMVIEDEDIAR
ncbi:ATPase [Pseudoroseicyclus aestuarii]|uniref:AAA+ ATPase domain-containing protein n=1 Tax=Pseudoroseicyclus aestuarii TaxID=1795041 RepID=A0A318SUD8_9RHOB|nr:ATPase [Pseudoroseicyclus aestuarii]PYE84975.1 hypothetical protein DFP88_102780 [Pseudoroseicyclus aestuarii]